MCKGKGKGKEEGEEEERAFREPVLKTVYGKSMEDVAKDESFADDNTYVEVVHGSFPEEE